MSFARSALCSSIAAAALVTTFAVFAPVPDTLGASAATATASAASRPSVADAAPLRRTAAKVVVASSDATCQKIRRKFWVEGEGWIVRRVATCY
jgi:hypothetical protein